MKPIEGAESEGALGFFKGVGKGLVGYTEVNYSHDNPVDHSTSAVTKPVVGVFDLASNVSEGESIPCPSIWHKIDRFRYSKHNNCV